MQEYKSIHGFEDEREHCLDIFRANAGDIFNLEIPPDDDFGEVVRRRYPVNIFNFYFILFIHSLQIFLLLNGGDRSADVWRP